MTAQPPETEGGEEETAKAEENNPASEEIADVAGEEGPPGAEAVQEAAPEPAQDVQGKQDAIADAAPEPQAPTLPAAAPVQARGRGGGGGEKPAMPAGGGVEFGDVDLAANGIDPSKLPPDAVEQVVGILQEMRAQDTEMANSFFGSRQADAAGLSSMSGQINARISGAAAESRGRVQSAAEGQKASISQAVAAAMAQVEAQAEQTRAAIDSQLQAVLAAIDASTEAGRSGLATEKQNALGQITAAEQAQRANVEQMYATADQQYRAAGQTVGGEAISRSESRAQTYLSQKINREDSFLDGHLTDNRCEARANAAREVGKSYQKGLADEANKQADAAMQNKARDLEAVTSAATAARTQLEQHYTTMLQQLEQSAQASRNAANQSAQGLRTAADQAAQTGRSSLQTHEQTQHAAIDTASQQALSGIDAQAQQAITGLDGGLGTAISDLNSALEQVRSSLGTPRIPSPEEFAASLGEAGQSFQSNLDLAKESISTGIDGAVQGIQESATSAIDGFTTTAGQAASVASETASQILQQLAQLQQSGQQAFEQVRTGHEQGIKASIESAKQGYGQIVQGLQQSYQAVAQQLQTGMQNNVTTLTNGLRGALNDMDAKITEEADKAAAQVQPRWKSVLKWVCIIAVIVVVAVVLGPLVVGAVGGVLGSGLLATVVGGAIVGAISGAATTLVSNAFDGNPLTQGLLQATLLGALGGGIGAGLGSVATQVATKGGQVAIGALKEFAISVSVDMVVDTTINALTGQLTWENFAQSLITSVLMNGAQTHPRIKGITEHFQATGEQFGQNVRSRVTGSSPTTPSTGSPGPAPDTSTPTQDAPAPAPHAPDTSTPTQDAPAPAPHAPAQDAPAPAPHAPAQDGPAPDAPAPAPHAPAQDAPAPAPHAPAQDGPAPDAPAPAPHAPVQDGPAPDAPAPHAPAQDGPAPDAPAPHGPTQDGPAPDAPAPHGPTQDGPAPEGPAPHGPTQDGPTQDGARPGETPSGGRREPSPELKAKANDVMSDIRARTDATTNPKTRKSNQEALEKIQQILDEQAPGVTDQLKMDFMNELQTRMGDPANANKDMFTMIRDTVNAASIKDAGGKVIGNKYLRQGEAVPLDALQNAGPLSRLYATDKVYEMLSSHAEAELAAMGVTKQNFGKFLEENPGFDIRSRLDPNAHVEGYNDVAWWGLTSEGKANNITELVDALALTPKNYPQGGVRFNISPETAHGANMTKPTAFDGMFPEWVPTTTDNPFGVTGGGKREGVVGRVPAAQSDHIEVFAGAPEQLINNRAKGLKEMFVSRRQGDATGLVDGVVQSSASGTTRSSFLEDCWNAMDTHPTKTPHEAFAEVIARKPEYSVFRSLLPAAP